MNKTEALNKCAELLNAYQEGEWNFDVYWETHNEHVGIRINPIGI